MSDVFWFEQTGPSTFVVMYTEPEARSGKACIWAGTERSVGRNHCRVLNRLFESHSRQLWLEAAEMVQEISGEFSDMHPARSIIQQFRAKAESTPKPSPALPTQREK